jgi:glycerophosphoryl diester phosphodiesterase
MSQTDVGTAAPPTMVCAHRGASADLPDNSIAAFEAAIASGCEAIETDIRRAPDGRLVLAHDPEEALAPGVVELPALLALARGRIGLDLELKEPGLEGDVLAAVQGGEDWLLVTSFLPAVVARVGLLAPGVRTGLLVEDDEDDPVAEALACGAAALAIEEALLTAPLAERAVEAGLALWAWTVNDPRRLDELLGAPAVAGVITDYPAGALTLREALAGRAVSNRSST